MRKFYPLLLCSLLIACASRENIEIEIPQDCPGAYAILPGNFIIDLESDSEVRLNPAIYQFELFCRPEMAKSKLDEMHAPRGDWAIYELEGNFVELATPCGKNQMCLNQPAKVKDWIQ